MYKRFAFEGEVHQSLSCVPLTVRRKLDLAGMKISLDGWQRLPREERMALCHLPVDGPDELTTYQEIMRGFCDRHGVECKPLTGVDEARRSWSGPDIPEAVAARVGELGLALAPAAWRALDEESRYALLKLSDPRQAAAKLRAVLAELGLVPLGGETPGGDPAACDRAGDPS